MEKYFPRKRSRDSEPNEASDDSDGGSIEDNIEEVIVIKYILLDCVYMNSQNSRIWSRSSY